MRYYIHDLDDNLQRFVPNVASAFYKAATEAATKDHGLDLTYEGMAEMIKASLDAGKNYFGLLKERFRLDDVAFHLNYNRRIDRGVIKPFPDLAGCFEALGDGALHCILTHSSEEWAGDSVRISGIEKYFPPERIVGLESYRALKDQSPKGFRVALDRLGAASVRDVVFSEDTLPNLVTAHRLGLRTVWSSHGRDLPPEYAEYVDHVVPDIRVFLKQEADSLKPA